MMKAWAAAAPTVRRRCLGTYSTPILTRTTSINANIRLTPIRYVVTQISPTTSLLRSDDSDNEVYLLGTAHISEASANEAIQLIEVVRPQKVFVELDPKRAARLRATENSRQANIEDPLEQAIQNAANHFAKAGGGLPTPFASSSGFGGGGANFFKDSIKSFYQMLRGYGYVPGIEMLAAMREADRIGAEIVYGDRDADDTMREMKDAFFNPATLMKLMTAPSPPPALQNIMMEISKGGMEGLGDATEMLKTRDNARMMSTYMDSAIPSVADVLIHRRDKAMAQNLKTFCGRGKVVAVVGLAHVDGIEREWQTLDRSKLRIES